VDANIARMNATLIKAEGLLEGQARKQFVANQRDSTNKHDALVKHLNEQREARKHIALPDDLEERIDARVRGLLDRHYRRPMHWSLKQKQSILDALFGEGSTRGGDYGIYLAKRALPNGHMVYKLTMRGLFGEVTSDGTGSANLPKGVLDGIAQAVEPGRPRLSNDDEIVSTVSRLFARA
jgi:hypothetical protein